jgi:hypothetical protein
MARDDYGAINVISEEEREILGIGGSKKPDDEEEGLFETIGKAGDKIGETKVGKKIGTILTVVMLALLSGGANMSIISEFFADDEEIGPIGGCLEDNATNYNPKATFDDGTCNFVVIVYGCMDPEAVNYDPQATHDNGRCNILNQNGTSNNETATNETVYGCMDIEANNYNDRADEDDGTCDYENEENHCNHTEMYAWNGLSHGNVSRPSNHSLDFFMDFDTNCDDPDDPLPMLVYFDLIHVFVVEDENGNKSMRYDNYVYTDVFLNVSGWTEDQHWFKYDDLFEIPLEDNFDNIYEGYWFYYTSYYADYNGDGDYYGNEAEDTADEYVGYSTNWGNGDIEEMGWVLSAPMDEG